MPKKLPTVNEVLYNAILQHQHYLLAVEKGTVARLRKRFQVAWAEAYKILASNKYDPSSWTYKRAQAAAKELDALVILSLRDYGDQLEDAMVKVIQAENAAQTRMLKEHLPFPVDHAVTFKPIDVAQALAWANAPLGAHNYKDRLKTVAKGMNDAVKDALATAATMGEGTRKAAKRIQQYVVGGELWKAERIARTELHRVAVRTQAEVWNRHEVILNGLQYVATLDDRTCPICASYDMARYWYGKASPNVASAPYIPQHPNCRCLLCPLTKTWKQLGFDEAFVKQHPSLKRLDDSTTKRPKGYAEWFKKQPVAVQKKILGPKLYRDWKAGRHKLRSMAQAVPKSLKPLDPKRLATLLGMAPGNAKPTKSIKGLPPPKKRKKTTGKASVADALLTARAMRRMMTDVLVKHTDRKTAAAYWRQVRKVRREAAAAEYGQVVRHVSAQDLRDALAQAAGHKNFNAMRWGMETMKPGAAKEALKAQVQAVRETAQKVQAAWGKEVGKAYRAFLKREGLAMTTDAATFDAWVWTDNDLPGVDGLTHLFNGDRTQAERLADAFKELRTELKRAGTKDGAAMLADLLARQNRGAVVLATHDSLAVRHAEAAGWAHCSGSIYARRSALAKSLDYRIQPGSAAKRLMRAQDPRWAEAFTKPAVQVDDVGVVPIFIKPQYVGRKGTLFHELGHAVADTTSRVGTDQAAKNPLVQLLAKRARRFGAAPAARMSGHARLYIKGPWAKRQYAGTFYSAAAPSGTKLAQDLLAGRATTGVEAFSCGAEHVPSLTVLAKPAKDQNTYDKMMAEEDAVSWFIQDPEHASAWFRAVRWIAQTGKYSPLGKAKK